MRQIVKKAVHVNDSTMPHTALDAQLETQLVHHHVRFNERLRYLFYSENSPSSNMTRTVHAPELPLPQFPPHLKFLNYTRLGYC